MLQESFDSPSLEDFWTALLERGFEPQPGSARSRWQGPIHPAFTSLTDAESMDISFDPGWPYRPPRVFVEGLDTSHYTLNGFVCLWREGDASLRWATVEGLFERIEEWCGRAKDNWIHDDLPFDAYLNFENKAPHMAAFDFETLRTSPGSWGEFHGNPSQERALIELLPGAAAPKRQPRGLWFRTGILKSPPPRQFSELPKHLNKAQRKGLERALSDRRIKEPFRISGGVDLILFAWERRGRTDLLIMAGDGIGDKVEAHVLMAEPNDDQTLILRAGPDAEELKNLRAVIFGAGALGGHVAVTLAESGLGSQTIVDPEFLTPGNVVRHVAGHDWVGALKVDAVKAVALSHAPWTHVETVAEMVVAPSKMSSLLGDADIVIDATGNESFVPAIAQAAAELKKSLISGALYRGGFISRVQRQALDSDIPISVRTPSDRYPSIPAGEPGDDQAEPDLGCSAPVNNAPPPSVLACASLISQAAIDVLTGRFELEDEVTEVYRRLPEPPFHRLGRLAKPDTTA